MTRIPTLTSLVALAGLLAGCDSGDDGKVQVECPSEAGPFRVEQSRVTGTLSFEPPTDPLGPGDTIFVSGTAFHEDSLAIREVRVAGVAATRDEFNFGRWTATVSYESIVTAAATSAEGQVVVTAAAIDACGKLYPFQTAVVDVDPTPHIAVDALTVNIEYPEERGFLPANGGVPAIITISATGRAAGAVVHVTADSGDLRGLNGASNVTLTESVSEDEDGNLVEVGQATLIFTPSEAGTATLVATVEDKLAVALVKVAAPPTLSPRRATLPPGSSIEVDIGGATDVSCTASADDDLVATHFDAPLSEDAMVIDVDEGGRRVIEVTASIEPLQSETEVIVTCTDDYGQTGSGRYRLGEAAVDAGGEDIPE